MSSVAEELAGLEREIQATPWNPAGFPRLRPLLDRAFRLADAAGDEPRAFLLRTQYIAVANNLHRVELALAPLSWCIAALDRSPGLMAVQDGRLLRVATVILQQIADLPEVPKPDLDRLLQDVEQRNLRAGLPMQTFYAMRQYVQMRLGDLAAAAEAYDRWRALPRTGSWTIDCDLCEIDAVVEWQEAIGADEDAVAAARPVIAGTVRQEGARCEKMRGQVLANVLAPLLRLGRPADAEAVHRLGVRDLRDPAVVLDQLSEHVVYLAATGGTARALELLDRHYGPAEERNERELYPIDSAVWLLLEALRDAGTGEITLRLPAWHPAHHPSRRYDVAELAARLAAPIRALNARYDARNGNTWVSDRLERRFALLRTNRPPRA